MKKHISYMAAILAMAGLAQAATTTQTQTEYVDEHKPNQNTVLTFDTFNTADTEFEQGKTLTGITISSSLQWWGGFYAVDNEASSASSGDLRLGVTAGLTSFDVYGIPAGAAALASSTSTHFDLAANNDDPVNEFNSDDPGLDYGRVDGPTYANSSPVSGSGNVASPLWYTYQSNGNGTFAITYASVQSQNWSGVGGKSVSGTDVSALGSVTITYTYDYTPIPEPTSLAFIGLGGLVLGLRRRVKKA